MSPAPPGSRDRGITDDDYVAPCHFLAPGFYPQVEYVMQIDVSQQRRGHRALGSASSASINILMRSGGLPLVRVNAMSAFRRRFTASISRAVIWAARSDSSALIGLSSARTST